MRLRRGRWLAVGAIVASVAAAGTVMISQAAGDESSFVAVTPTRVLDTRLGVGLTGKFVSETARLLTVTGPVATTGGTMQVVPPGATAVVLNVTAVLPSGGGFVSVRPGDAAGAPSTSNLNFAAGSVVPNAVTVALPPAGNLNLYYFGGTGATTDLLIDIVGYYLVGEPGPDGADGAHGNAGPNFGREVFYTIGPESGDLGLQPSIAIGSDGLPIIAHRDDRVGTPDLRVTHCNDTACSSSASLEIEADTGWVIALAIGSDGLPVIAHATTPGSDVRVTHCNDLTCSTSTQTTLSTVGVNDSIAPAIAIGTDGFPIIAHRNAAGELRVTHCANVACTSATHTAYDLPSTDTGRNPSIAIGSDGFAIIAHTTTAAGDAVLASDLLVTHCENVLCSAGTTTTVDATGDVGLETSIAIGTDGLALIAHRDGVAGDLRVSHCTDVACTVATSTSVDGSTADVGHFSTMTIGVDGLAIIAHRNATTNDLRISRCSNTTCTAATSTDVLGPAAVDGKDPSIVIGRDSHAIIAHRGDSGLGLRVTKVVHMSWTVNGWES